MKKQLLILMALSLSFIGFSQTVGDQFIDNYITYEITSLTPNTVMTRDYDFNGGGSEVIIPATVNYNSVVFNVTIIHTNSFSILNEELTNVVIPNSVVQIRSGAFIGNAFTSVVIPSSVTSIGLQAFAGNNFLTCVVSEAITPPTIYTGGNGDTFGDLGFGTRSNINVVIPNGTSAAYTNATWTGFQSVTEVLSVNDTFVTDNITYKVTSTSNNTVAITDYDINGGTVVDIPAIVTSSCSVMYNVTSIDIAAFQSKQLTSVILPNSITNIEHHAFNDNLITNLIIPANMTNIDYLAFANNPLNNITLLGNTPPTISTSAGGTFLNRSSIDLILPNGTTDEYVTDSGALWTGFKMVYEVIPSTTALKVADYDSSNGTNVSIPATITDASVTYDVTEIGISAFFDKGLTSVTIPNSITTIGTSAFNTNNLTSVTIPDSVTIIGSQAFVTNDLTTITIGNNVTEIGLGAFVDNDLTSITIPNSVTQIGPIAFAANPLTSATSLATTPPVITTGTNDTFNITGDRSNIHLHIPAGTMGAYVIDPGALWTGFNPVTEDAGLSTSDFELAYDIKIITASDKVEVKHSNNIELEQYNIYSISGAKIKEGKENTINVNTLSNGIYILELKFNEGRIAKKFVK